MSFRFNQYLLLFAVCFTNLVCKSPDNQILDAFKEVDDSLGVVNRIGDSSFEAIHDRIILDRERYSDLSVEIDSLYKLKRKSDNLLDSIKFLLNSADSTGARLTTASKFLIETSLGDSLSVILLTTVKYAESMVRDQKVQINLRKAATDIVEIAEDENVKRGYFERTPTVGAVTILNKLKNDLNIIGELTLRYIIQTA